VANFSLRAAVSPVGEGGGAHLIAIRSGGGI